MKKKEFFTFRGYEMQRKNKMYLTASMEDYLEMISRQCEGNRIVRINSLAEQLNVQAPSVTKVVQKLAKIGLLAYEKYGIIQLTEKGKKIGDFLLARHRTIETFLRHIGVRESCILKETEMIEHYLSIDSVRNIELLNEFFTKNPDIVERLKKFIIARENEGFGICNAAKELHKMLFSEEGRN
ncbi:metal-dependent transcriptional regulator [Thermoanaerobacterium sp. DL9XJH110]|uniref:metal-dependent transcriptional regulator n=1 Tax=Thermoanaerobacterium sp. DL9XJH110 TaxID=3386643 RepID=UPI003BB7AC87